MSIPETSLQEVEKAFKEEKPQPVSVKSRSVRLQKLR